MWSYFVIRGPWSQIPAPLLEKLLKHNGRVSFGLGAGSRACAGALARNSCGFHILLDQHRLVSVGSCEPVSLPRADDM
jgi:hypothetical protein